MIIHKAVFLSNYAISMRELHKLRVVVDSPLLITKSHNNPLFIEGISAKLTRSTYLEEVGEPVLRMLLIIETENCHII